MMPTVPDTTPSPKYPSGRPFPWHCPKCRQKTVNLKTVRYEGERLHDGTKYRVVVPELEVPVCGNCGERVFNYRTEEQIIEALEKALTASSPPTIPNPSSPKVSGSDFAPERSVPDTFPRPRIDCPHGE
ncbi:MAG: hypothetical protein L0Z62_25680 [Gemmataceae bacterium]|nr:hypothetical protein [Gemmataceae bacterium]